jgi:uncharacterized membrane protein
MATFYFFAGVNHFIKPENYKKIIPPFIPFHSLINYATGFIEIGLAILLIIPRTRKFACTAIIVMLIFLIPAHIYMLQTGWVINGNQIPEWLLWVRLLVLQPLLILWAWMLRKSAINPY